MRYAFSPDNPGYVPGRLGGLGSVHSPGTRPLGDMQEWVAADLLDDPAAGSAALRRLAVVSGASGRLPETYDPDTGEWLSRHWFAWPGAAAGALHMLRDRGTGPWAADVDVPGWPRGGR